MPAKARYLQYFGKFWRFVAELQHDDVAESEKSVRESFIFRAESGSIGRSASNPVVFVVHTTQIIRKTGQAFEDALRDQVQF